MPGAPDQVVYVWCDALINYNYLTGVGYASDGRGFAEAWSLDVQITGKDITWSTRSSGPPCSWPWICRDRSGPSPTGTSMGRSETEQVRE